MEASNTVQTPIDIYISDFVSAQSYKSYQPWAAIQIAATPEFAPMLTENRVGLLQLVFEDIRHISDIHTDYGKSIVFDANIAKQVLVFVQNLPRKVQTLLVQCGAGISRSAAIAQSLCEATGTDISLFKKYYSSNPGVLSLMRKTLAGQFPTDIKFKYKAYFRGYYDGVPRLFHTD